MLGVGLESAQSSAVEQPVGEGVVNEASIETDQSGGREQRPT